MSHQPRKLRIAVDFPWDASACMGTGAYSETTIRALARAAPQSKIYLIEPPSHGRLIRLPNVEYLSVPQTDTRQEGPRQVGLPSILSAIRADCLFAPASLLPLYPVCPMVATVHDLTFASHPEYYDPGLVHYLERWFEPSLRVADHIVAVSEETKQELVASQRVSAGKVTVIEQPVREAFLERLPEGRAKAIVRSMGIRSPFLFHVSNLSLHKNVFFALEVFQRALEGRSDQDLVFVVAGGGYAPSRPPDFMEKAVEMSLKDRVLYAGRVTDLELKALYEECEAFLFPSLAEGWGLPVAEARSEGARVLSSPFVPAADPADRLPLEIDRWVSALAEVPARREPLRSTFESAGKALLRILESVSMGRKRCTPIPEEMESAEPALPKAEPQVVIRGDFRSPSGMGQAARNLYQGMKTAGLHPMALSTPKDGIQDRKLWPGSVELYLDRADLWIHTLPPDRYDLGLPGKHVGLFFWETDRLPEEKPGRPSWKENLNRLDEIWVASTFFVPVLRGSGITRPIEVIPVPIDTNLFSPGPRRIPREISPTPAGLDPSWTVVLYTGTWDPRKRPDLLVRAFTEAFSEGDRALLVLKTYVTGEPAKDRAILEGWIAGCRAGSGHVRVIPEVLSEREMADLFRFSTLFATASRGEGFCLPAAQALSCGKPVLGVKWSALSDLVSLPVGHRLEHIPSEVNLPGYSPAQRWAAIDLGDLKAKLRFSHENREKMAQLGRKGREWALSSLSFQAAGERLRPIIDRLLTVPIPLIQGALA
jgi:glycosyltransferase involved in cell wall biosynthesis